MAARPSMADYEDFVNDDEAAVVVYDPKVGGKLASEFSRLKATRNYTPEDFLSLIEVFTGAQTYDMQCELVDHITNLYLESEANLKDEFHRHLMQLQRSMEEQANLAFSSASADAAQAREACLWVNGRLEGVNIQVSSLQRMVVDNSEKMRQAVVDVTRAVSEQHVSERARAEVTEAGLRSAQQALYDDVGTLRSMVDRSQQDALDAITKVTARIRVAETTLALMGDPTLKMARIADQLRKDITDAIRRVNEAIEAAAAEHKAFVGVTELKTASLEDKVTRMRDSLERVKQAARTRPAPTGGVSGQQLEDRLGQFAETFRVEVAEIVRDTGLSTKLDTITRQLNQIVAAQAAIGRRIDELQGHTHQRITSIEELMNRRIHEVEQRLTASQNAFISDMKARSTEQRVTPKVHETDRQVNFIHGMRNTATEPLSTMSKGIPASLNVRRSNVVLQSPAPRQPEVLAMETRVEALEAQIRAQQNQRPESISTVTSDNAKEKTDAFLRAVRDESRRRNEFDASSSDDDVATDPEDERSVTTALGAMSQAERNVPHDKKHLTFVSFATLPLIEFVSRWRDRFRRYATNPSQLAEAETMITRLTTSHQMATSTGNSSTKLAYYVSMTSHRRLLIEIAQAELRWRGATLAHQHAVPTVLEKEWLERRRRPMQFDEIVEKSARYTVPKAFAAYPKRGGRKGRKEDRSFDNKRTSSAPPTKPK